VVVLTNLNGTQATSAISYDIVDRFLGLERKDWTGDIKKIADRFQAQGDSAVRRREAARAKDSKPSLALTEYAGTFTDSLYGGITVKHENGALVLNSELRQGVSATLEHWHYDTFRARWSEPRLGTMLVTFGLNADARVRSLDVEGLGTFQRAPERPR
jgi:hypothetical protein